MKLARCLSHSQNFLKSPKLIEKLIKQASVRSPDTVLDIGAGKGIIADSLVSTDCRIIAIEKDPKLAQELRTKFDSQDQIQVWQGDFLNYPLEELPKYKVFANPPFNFTTDIVRKLTESSSAPLDAYLVVQKDAADRFMGRAKEGLASLRIKPWFDLSLVHHFRRQDFELTPGVDPVLLRILKRETALVAEDNRSTYLDFIAFVFSQWQPTLKRALGPVFTNQQFDRLVQNLRIPARLKPTEASFEQYLGMFNLLLQRIGNRTAIKDAARKMEKQQKGLKKDYRTRFKFLTKSRRW